MDRFDANLLAAFDVADGKLKEDEMRDAAEASWEVWDGTGDWEMGKVWAEKREIFYEQGKWNPLDNVTCVILKTSITAHAHGWSGRKAV
jgi:recyclin-1